MKVDRITSFKAFNFQHFDDDYHFKNWWRSYEAEISIFQAALKVESNYVQGGSVLKLETIVLRALESKPHVARLLAAAKKEHYSYIVMTLHGESLNQLMKHVDSFRQAFPLKFASISKHRNFDLENDSLENSKYQTSKSNVWRNSFENFISISKLQNSVC